MFLTRIGIIISLRNFLDVIRREKRRQNMGVFICKLILCMLVLGASLFSDDNTCYQCPDVKCENGTRQQIVTGNCSSCSGQALCDSLDRNPLCREAPIPCTQ